MAGECQKRERNLDLGRNWGGRELEKLWSSFFPSSFLHRADPTKDQDKVIKAPEGEGCPKCEGYVYHADQVGGN